MSDIEEYRGSLEARLEQLDALESDGWEVQHALESVCVRTIGRSDYRSAVRQVRLLDAVVPVRVRANFGSAYILLEVDASGTESLIEASGGDLSAHFGGKDLAAARSAWQGNLARLNELPSPLWDVEVELALGATIDGQRFLVFDSLSLLTAAIQATPVWNLGTLFRSGERTVAIVRELPLGHFLRSDSLVVMAASDLDELSSPSRVSEKIIPWSHPLMKGCPDPLSLRAVTFGGSLQNMAEDFARLSATLCWIALASRIEIETVQATLEFLGFQRVSWSVGRCGIAMSPDEVDASLRLYQWAAGEGATLDHQIAVRQIVSVNPDIAPWTRAADIALAAEPVVVGLRSDAVSEAFRARRDIEQLAQASALQAAERSAAIARSTIERSTALVIAAAGIFVAQSLDAITEGIAGQLRLLLAIVFCVLALWNIFLEGPLVSLPIRTFRVDLPKFGPLLSEAERESIGSMATLTTAANRALALRIAVPIVFGAFSLGLFATLLIASA